MDVVVAPLLHNKVPVVPLAVNTELPQLLTTVTVGVAGVAFGAGLDRWEQAPAVREEPVGPVEQVQAVVVLAGELDPGAVCAELDTQIIITRARAIQRKRSLRIIAIPWRCEWIF